MILSQSISISNTLNKRICLLQVLAALLLYQSFVSLKKILTRRAFKYATCQPGQNYGNFEVEQNKTCASMVFVFPPGQGLGNILFEYASAVGITNKTNRKLIYGESFFPLNDLFSTNLPTLNLQGDAEFEILDSCACCKYDGNIGRMPCHLTGLMRGHHQSYKYFHHIQLEILQQLQFPLDIQEEAHLRIAEIVRKHKERTNETDCLLIGTHLRRGDVTKADKINFGHLPANAEYLPKAYNYYKNKFPNDCLIFLVTGDDHSWNSQAADQLHQKNVYVLEPRPKIHSCDPRISREVACVLDAALDMCTLSKCNHSIISTGTFGWWSAYLTGGMVTYQDQFVRPGSVFEKQYDRDDYIPAKWVAL